MVNFQKAIKWLKQGKKVRRSQWAKGCYYLAKPMFGSKMIVFFDEEGKESSEKMSLIRLDEIDADNWELLKEKEYCKECGKAL